MNGELIAILEQMERERGIKKDVLIKAVETALTSAVKKVVDAKPGVNIRVELNKDNGDIKAYADDKPITSIDMGRIAAQTAKQVIIQKIREAEKDVVFEEFQGKIGEIVSGTVYRFERGNMVVDLLGKAEGLLLRNEQSPKEEFKQGDRIRAYIVSVKKEVKGPQILLSRTQSNFVRKLFELEVPEIYDGIVEIKAISRQPGERTKISVGSKEDRIDSVGACVGMRGSRVKNIVTELHGEKIDIVRYSDDIREYIKNSLSPAKISEIQLNKEGKRAEVIVDDDQLSLCIGKQGQNVRLASKLIGWELDIRTKTQLKEKEAALTAAAEEQAAPAVEQPLPQGEEVSADAGLSLDIKGVGDKLIGALKEAGFSTLEAIANSSVEALTEIKGIGPKKAGQIINEAKEKLSQR